MALYKIQASRVNNIEADQYTGSVVEEGQIWYDPVYGTLRLYNGNVGGYIINSGSGNINLSAVGQNIVPSTNTTYTLGTPTLRWSELYVGNGSIYLGNVSVSTQGNAVVIDNISANTVSVAGTVSATGNITGQYFIGNGSLLTGINSGSSLPSQTGNAGLYLSTDGSTLSWDSVPGVFNLVIDGGTANTTYSDFIIDGGTA